MKSYITIILTLIIFLAGCTRDVIEEVPPEGEANETRTESPYYYYGYGGKKIYLAKIPDKYYVVYKKDKLNSLSASATRSGASLNPAGVHEYSFDITVPEATGKQFYSESVWTTIESVKRADLSGALYVGDYFKTQDGYELGLTETFSVKLKDESDADKLTEFAKQTGTVIASHNIIRPLWYSLVCTPKSEGTALEIANRAYESGLFAATDVGFLSSPVLCYREPSGLFNDPAYRDQWNLYNENDKDLDISFEEAHALTSGDPSITIVDIGFGIKLDLPDLRITRSWDATSGTSPARLYTYPEPMDTEHQTNTSSIIHATPNNGIGIVGIAPDAGFMAISVQYGKKNWGDRMADAITYAVNNGACVINNSWLTRYYNNAIYYALEDALTNGRNGKGCVVVFAAGNEGQEIARYPYCDFPDILTVGSIGPSGKRPPAGSNYGDFLDVVAPGELIPVLSLTQEYNLYFGTSLAAPQVASIAALMLSVSPDLTGAEVCDIIESTTKKLDAYRFEVGKPNGTWNKELGYGLVNAYDAVMTVMPSKRTISNETYSQNAKFAGRSLTFNNVKTTSQAEVEAKAITNYLLFNTLEVNSRSKLTAEAKTFINYKGLKVTDNAQLHSTSDAGVILENVEVTDYGKLDFTASEYNIFPGFSVAKGAQLRLDFVD